MRDVQAFWRRVTICFTAQFHLRDTKLHISPNSLRVSTVGVAAKYWGQEQEPFLSLGPLDGRVSAAGVESLGGVPPFSRCVIVVQQFGAWCHPRVSQHKQKL